MKALLLRVGLTLAVLTGVFAVTMSTASAAPEEQVVVTECVPNYWLGQTCASGYVGYAAAVPFAYSYAAYPSYYQASYPYAANYGYRPYGGYHRNGHEHGHGHSRWR